MNGWRWGLVSALVTAVSGLAYANRIERHRLVLERVVVSIDHFPPELHNLKIVHMSDFHLYPHTPLSLVEKAVQKSNQCEPDLVALTGDYVHGYAGAVHDLAQALGRLRSRYGVFATLGNHDWTPDPAILRAAFAEVGIPLLVNQAVSLVINGQALYVAGVDDFSWGRPDLNQALAAVPAGAPVILLAHQPDAADFFTSDGRVALQLSGHSHGGQVRLPGLGPIILPAHGRRYHTGLYRVGNMWLYTTRGIGVHRLPLRFSCPPEVTELQIQSVN